MKKIRNHQSTDYAVVLAARIGSERLPGKALVSYCPDETPNIAQIIRRWQTSRRDPAIVAALPDTPENDTLAKVCRREDIPVYRGSESDVVARMDGAIREFSPNAKYVARALADNPLVDVGLADWRLDALALTRADGLWCGPYHDRITYAGTTDVWSRSAWDRIASESSGSQREHPGSYWWDNLSRFSVVTLPPPPREYLRSLRTELDTPEDLAMLREVFAARAAAFEPYARTVPLVQTLWALDWLNEHPQVAELNAQVQLKTQSKPLWPKGLGWLCKKCQARMGSIIAGDLEVRCANCGAPGKFYAQKPKRHNESRDT